MIDMQGLGGGGPYQVALPSTLRQMGVCKWWTGLLEWWTTGLSIFLCRSPAGQISPPYIHCLASIHAGDVVYR